LPSIQAFLDAPYSTTNTSCLYVGQLLSALVVTVVRFKTVETPELHNDPREAATLIGEEAFIIPTKSTTKHTANALIITPAFSQLHYLL
jgi:hypothetical protein